jgi:MarR family transcriptional regulator, organic hydroperoxide resistance regulator
MIVDMDDTWELLMDLVMAERARIPQIAAEFRLSPPQVHALRLLEPEQPLPMGRLACALGCDASNVTGIVDRLEQRGLIERRPSARDRRVKVLVVTAQGAEVRKALMIRLGEPPQSIASLSPADRRRLAGLLRRALSQAAAAPAP